MEVNLSLHAKQTVAFESQATEILYGGAAGGGKSHLMRVLAVTFCYLIPNFQAYIFRRISGDLEKNHLYGESGLMSMLAPWINQGLVSYNGSKSHFKFWNGAMIHLCHCQHEKDMYKYDGAEIHLLLIDELTHFLETIYTFLRGRCRLGGVVIPDEYKGQFPKIVSGSNPGGIGHNWVKNYFINNCEPLEIRKMPKKDGGMQRQFIPAFLEDNPTLLENDPTYEDKLEGLNDPALAKAKRWGDWNIVSGGALDDVWTSNVIVPRFKVPASWHIDRAFDWGSSHPFSVGWFAEADGTEAKLENGSTFCPPPGSLILIHEWYGASGPNTGLKLDPKEISDGIKSREAVLKSDGWIDSDVRPGPADNQIGQTTRTDVDTIKKVMEDNGIYWTESDKSSGSRKNGLELIRTRLKASNQEHPEDPALYFMKHCRNIIDHLPVLPRDQKNTDDVDSSSEDHDYDMLRYRVLASNNRDAKKLDIKFAL